MATYKKTVFIHGAPTTVTQVCPFDGLSNLSYPVYLNSVNPSGLVQPYGPIDDRGLVSVSGIVKPVWNPDPSGYGRYAPSGLSITITDPAANGTNGFGKNTTTYYKDINLYQNYWSCPNNHYFIYPSGLGTGSTVGNNSGATPNSFGQFE